jgi:hypothetical protein
MLSTYLSITFFVIIRPTVCRHPIERIILVVQ